jgi:uncharacterized membrane protein
VPRRGGPARRLLGVDAARGLALLGMMSVHVFPSVSVDGRVSPAFLVAAGRSSALFATLLGVGLALLSGATTPVRSTGLRRAQVATLARAGVVGLVGLLLALADPPVAVILVYYAVLMAIAVPLLGLRARPLAVLATASVIVVPVLLFAWRRAGLSDLPFENPGFASLARPGDLLRTLLVVGVYPVLAWTAYLFGGMALGRVPLTQPRVLRRALAVGASVAALAWLASWVLTRQLGGLATIAAAQGGDEASLRTELTVGLFGTVPTTTWWWLSVVAPHSTTPFDMAHTLGVAVAVVAALSLVALRRPALVSPLAALGSMTLTLYSLHCLLLAFDVVSGTPGTVYLVHVLLLATVALAFQAAGVRGPLEAVASTVARAAGGLVPPRRR